MLTLVPPTDCMSAREAASARLDGEVSPFEAARLDAHLLGCAACRCFAAEIASIAVELRDAALERPSRTATAPPRRRRIRVPAAAAVAASLVVAVTASSFALGHVIGAHSSPKKAALEATEVVRLREDSTQQHLLALLNPFEPRRQGLARMRAV